MTGQGQSLRTTSTTQTNTTALTVSASDLQQVNKKNKIQQQNTDALSCVYNLHTSETLESVELVSWSLTSLFSTNMTISETNGHSL